MTVPITYSLRNLLVRKTTTIMTAMGIALTVAVLVAVLALVAGLRSSFAATGSPLNVLVMRKGATAELVSVITREDFQVMRVKPGIARGRNGESLASLELVNIISNLGTGNLGDSMNVNMRALAPAGIEMRDQVRLIAGHWFEPGRRQIVVGKSLVSRFPGVRLGARVRFGRGEWNIVGVMDGGRSTSSSEVFADLNQVSADWNRTEYLSSVLIRATDAVAAQALRNSLEGDRRLNVSAQNEKEYYDAQTRSAQPIQFMGLLICSIMAVGSSFAAMNTMYAAVAHRSADIGVLRVLGFSRPEILFSFLLESLFLSAVGGVLGCLLVLPLQNTGTRIGSFVTFSEISFNLRITPQLMAVGIAFGMLMGIMGGLLPARTASRKEILAAFREA